MGAMRDDSGDKICGACPCRTPFLADHKKIARARELDFEPPLDEGIKEIVCTLIAHGIQTCESCQGGDGHAYHDPTVRFEGDVSEGLRAVSVALAYGFPVARLQRVWSVVQSMLHGPWWEMTFIPPRPTSRLRED
jgi:hypothetical protein